MADKTYSYHGPLSAVTLAADAAHPNGRHAQLFPGSHVTLPDDNPYVCTLVARKYLVPVTEAAPAATAPATTTTETVSPEAAPSAASTAADTATTATTETEGA